jgi:uncharacterized DUF497 family protein
MEAPQELVFVWDEKKNRQNLQKHGIDFDTAIIVFKDLNLIKLYDREHSCEEDRWNIIGVVGSVVLFVVETEITDNIIRIISARKANKQEREAYSNENNISYDTGNNIRKKFKTITKT